jgi:hypothetical protein
LFPEGKTRSSYLSAHAVDHGNDHDRQNTPVGQQPWYFTAGEALAYVDYEEEPGRRTAAKLMTQDEAWRIAVNIATLPDPLRR